MACVLSLCEYEVYFAAGASTAVRARWTSTTCDILRQRPVATPLPRDLYSGTSGYRHGTSVSCRHQFVANNTWVVTEFT